MSLISSPIRSTIEEFEANPPIVSALELLEPSPLRVSRRRGWRTLFHGSRPRGAQQDSALGNRRETSQAPCCLGREGLGHDGKGLHPGPSRRNPPDVFVRRGAERRPCPAPLGWPVTRTNDSGANPYRFAIRGTGYQSPGAGFLYDDFSLPFIDQDKWQEGILVREIDVAGQQLVLKAGTPIPSLMTGFILGVGGERAHYTPVTPINPARRPRKERGKQCCFARGRGARCSSGDAHDAERGESRWRGRGSRRSVHLSEDFTVLRNALNT
jgi:hypothetical protein